jgi:hypothetical protein
MGSPVSWNVNSPLLLFRVIVNVLSMPVDAVYVATPAASMCKIAAGSLFTSFTVTVIVSSSNKLGVPSSLTRTVNV